MDFIAILNHLMGFILYLYGSLDLSRKMVQNILTYIIDFNKTMYLPSIKQDVLAILREENVSDYCLSRIDQCFEQHIRIFDCVNTEANRFNILRERGFLEPEEFFIGRTFVPTCASDSDIFVPENMYGVRIPLKDSLKIFLEIPGLYNQIINYLEKLSKPSDIITNVLQAQLWTQKYSKKFIKDVVLPLYVFYDDLEVGNALGSHAGKNKFGAIYVSIACLPPSISSKLNSIIFSSLIYTSDKKESDNEHIFEVLINELNLLQTEGIIIRHDGIETRVKFQIIFILGDNLGLNGIFGFVECFKAKFYCRICKASSEDCSKMVGEDISILRNKINYEVDVLVANEKTTGVKERCIFHKLYDFHLTENVSVDLMHDFLEGVCYYVIKSLLQTYIFEKKYFTLHQLNNKIQNFNFGLYKMNKPAFIRMDQAKNALNLKISASEMMSLVIFLGIIIGDLIPRSDTRWNLFKYLRQIYDIVLSPRYIPAHATILKDSIKKFEPIIHTVL